MSFLKLLPQVFIGGRNRLFQLSPDLNIVATAITGPKNVSNECVFGKCTHNETRNPIDNVNKVLLIDYTTSRLIACGSFGQGYCNVVNLQNVSIIEKEIQEAVVANNERTYPLLFFFSLCLLPLFLLSSIQCSVENSYVELAYPFHR